jgi:predicted nucleic acid-binding protein
MLVDTDILIDYLRGYSDAVSFLEKNVDKVSVSAVSVAELYQGVREGEERTALRSMTSAFTLLALTDEIAEIAGLYKRDYGEQIGCGLADCMIAATANFHDLELVTRNEKHFKMLKSVTVPYVKS